MEKDKLLKLLEERNFLEAIHYCLESRDDYELVIRTLINCIDKWTVNCLETISTPTGKNTLDKETFRQEYLGEWVQPEYKIRKAHEDGVRRIVKGMTSGRIKIKEFRQRLIGELIQPEHKAYENGVHRVGQGTISDRFTSDKPTFYEVEKGLGKTDRDNKHEEQNDEIGHHRKSVLKDLQFKESNDNSYNHEKPVVGLPETFWKECNNDWIIINENDYTHHIEFFRQSDKHHIIITKEGYFNLYEYSDEDEFKKSALFPLNPKEGEIYPVKVAGKFRFYKSIKNYWQLI